MRLFFIYLFFLFCFFVITKGQDVVILNTPQSPSLNQEIKAREEIRLNGNFSVKPNTNITFSAKIDEAYVGETNYEEEIFDTNNTDHPHNRVLDTSLPVGKIGCSFDVSPMGGAIYNIPIELPEGVNGMTPSLSITYNSHGGNGIMGIGWNLNGLSVITRTGMTIYHDGISLPMSFNPNNDRLLLNGQRLISIDPNYDGLEAEEYRTEIESFSKITKTNNGANRYFTVKTKDGKTIEYGKTTDSRVMVSGSGTERVIAWMISRETDPYGNFINYIYHQNSTTGEHYVQRIEYGYGTTVVGAVYFVYDKRDDIWKSNVTSLDKGIVQTVLLRRITILDNGLRVGRYVFNYHDTNGISKLAEVIKENGKGEQLNSTLFTWDKPDVNLNAASKSVNNLISGFEYIPVKISYNGQMGLLGVSTTDPNKITWRMITSTPGTSDFSQAANFTIDVNFGSPNIHPLDEYCNDLDHNSRYDKVVNDMQRVFAYTVGDFDGDGITELAVLSHTYYITNAVCDYINNGAPIFNIDNLSKKTSKISLFRISNGINFIYSQSFNYNPYINPTLLNKTIDFNHDGKDDLVISNVIYDYSGKTTGFVVIGYSFDTPTNESEAQWGDFNGDGRLDYIAKEYISQNRKVYIQNADDYEFTHILTLSQDKFLGIIDINNDGVSEFIMRSATQVNSSYNIYIVNLNNETICELPPYTGTGEPSHAIVADIDADGTQDIILCRTNGDNVYGEKIYYRIRYSESSNSYTCQVIDRHFSVEKAIQGDFDGDGIIEIISNNTSNNNAYLYKFTTGKPGNLLSSIVDGYNQKTVIEYKPLSKGGDFYEKVNKTYPLIGLTGPFYVVSKVTLDNGSISPIEVNYSYKEGIIHLHGKGLLGFGTIKASNVNTGIAIETKNTFHSTWHLPSKIEITTTAENSFMSETTTDITFNTISGKRIHIYPNQQTVKDMYNNLTTTTYTVNTDGNVTNEHTAFSYDGSYTTTVYSNYTTTMGTLVPNKPQTIISKRKHSDHTEISNTTKFEYNSTLGHITKKTENYGIVDKNIIYNYLYDNFGNVNKITHNFAYHNGTGFERKQTEQTFTYDVNNRYVKTITAKPFDNVEKTIEYEYDNKGNITSETDLYTNLTTSYTYDSWSRLTETVYPDGNNETTIIGWKDDLSGYKIINAATGQPSITTIYDLVGRQKKIETVGEGGIEITKQYLYNNKGKLQSENSKRGDLNKNTIYYYDNYGRLTQKYRTNVFNITYNYFNHYTTTTHDGKTTFQYYDSWGNVKKTIDRLGNETDYVYHSLGVPKQITAADVVNNMEYDQVGNQTKLIDPNAGTIYYEYDGLGRLFKQTDAEQNIQTIKYDAWGRTDESKLNGITTKYTYINAGYGKGQVKKILDQNTNHYFEYDYDELGRPLQEKRYISGSGAFTTSFTYNNEGKVESITYPQEIVETLFYDSNGFLDEVKVNNNPVWKLETVSHTETKSTLGGIMTSKTKYDGNNGLLTGLETKIGNSQPLRNYVYDFNPTTGTLNNRSGIYNNITETFDYDDLYRLTQVTGGDEMTVIYEDNGNILHKSGVGNYAYTSKPHAVKKVTHPSNTISAETQQISYNSFNKVSSISETVNNQVYNLAISYGPDRQRIKSTLKENGTTIKTTLYAGAYERITKGDINTHLIYISGGEGLCGIYVKQTQGNTILKDEMYYVHPDHLGSFTLITDALGNIIQKCTFDAWGKREFVTKDPTFVFERGYTGHEHYDEFTLIDMNGRMYDPVLGRFLSPDPYVQSPLYSQSYNRYSYAVNNPLVFIDPEGYNFTRSINDAPESYGSFPTLYLYNGKGEIVGGGGGFHQFGHLDFDSYTDNNFGKSSIGSFFITVGDFFRILFVFDSNTPKLGEDFCGLVDFLFENYDEFDYVQTDDNNISDSKKTKYFSNLMLAFEYMWEKTFEDWVGKREVSGWITKSGGVIVLPYDRNSKSLSYNDALKTKIVNYKLQVFFNNRWVDVSSHVHSHTEKEYPTAHPIGLSKEDLNFMKKYRFKVIYILHNGNAYTVDGNYDWKKNNWSYKYYGTW